MKGSLEKWFAKLEKKWIFITILNKNMPKLLRVLRALASGRAFVSFGQVNHKFFSIILEQWVSWMWDICGKNRLWILEQWVRLGCRTAWASGSSSSPPPVTFSRKLDLVYLWVISVIYVSCFNWGILLRKNNKLLFITWLVGPLLDPLLPSSFFFHLEWKWKRPPFFFFFFYLFIFQSCCIALFTNNNNNKK